MVDVMTAAPDAVSVVIRRRIARAASEISALLSGAPAAFLGATEDAEDLPPGRYAVPLHVRFAGVHFDRTAAVGFAPMVEEDDGRKILPLWWEAAEQPWLFPTFDGGLEVRPDKGETELRLEGRYRPPLGAAGSLVNRAVLNKAATASLEALLDRMAARLSRFEN